MPIVELIPVYARQANCRTVWRFYRFNAGLGYSQAKLDFAEWFKVACNDTVGLGALVWKAIAREYDLWN